MDVADAERIVNEYGAAMEKAAGIASGVAAPESMLPYKKAVIKSAIKTLIGASISKRIYGEEARNALQVGYLTLASFISDDKAKIVIAAQKEISAGSPSAAQTSKEALLPRIASSEAVPKSSQIQKEILAEMEYLKTEIETFELQQLLSLAASECKRT